MAGIDAFGTQLLRLNLGVYTAIANVSGFKGPGIKRDTDDVTAHDSPTRWREYIGTLVTAGEIKVEINYDSSQHNTLISDFEDTTARGYKLRYPLNGSEWAFNAFITGFEVDAPIDGKQAASVTFQVTGKPTITTPAP